MRALAGLLTCALCCAQATDSFEFADVHASAKSAGNRLVGNAPPRGGRYEIKAANMVDLIRIAWGFDADKILGGPSWLELDRYDVIAKVPEDSTAETRKAMLQALLRERFRLAIHPETKPLPTYALVAGKKPLLKQAEGSEQMGCRVQTGAPGAPGDGTIRMMTMSAEGVATSFTLGPGMTIQYLCRNISMAAFAEGLRGMMGASVGSNPIADETGLKGAWNFDVKWSMMGGPMPGAGERISTFEALEKQLGLKLEPRQIPTPVMVVDSVDREPAKNPPGVAEALPPIRVATEFEVADVKLGDPNVRGMNFRTQAGGRVVAQGATMRFLVSRAFGNPGLEEVIGLPKWADTDRFDITARAPAAGPAAPPLDQESMAPMMLALLVDRFKLTYHREDRPVTAYSLVAGKPKMKKADPASRTSCKFPKVPPGLPSGTRVMACQNMTMALFAESLRNMAPELSWPVLDGTDLPGGWDFTLTYTQNFAARMMGMPGGGLPMPPPPPGGDAAAGTGAAEPQGGVTLFEAVEKQLGLKLEKQKRTVPVIAIDHVEQKPTEN